MDSSVMDGNGVSGKVSGGNGISWRCEACEVFASRLRESKSREPGGAAGLAVEVLAMAAAVGLGLYVFKATGLSGAESGLLKAVFGVATVLWMVAMARLGLRAG